MKPKKFNPMRQQPFDAGQNVPTEMQPAVPRPGRRPITAKPLDEPVKSSVRESMAKLRLASLRKQRDATRT